MAFLTLRSTQVDIIHSVLLPPHQNIHTYTIYTIYIIQQIVKL